MAWTMAAPAGTRAPALDRLKTDLTVKAPEIEMQVRAPLKTTGTGVVWSLAAPDRLLEA